MNLDSLANLILPWTLFWLLLGYRFYNRHVYLRVFDLIVLLYYILVHMYHDLKRLVMGEIKGALIPYWEKIG